MRQSFLFVHVRHTHIIRRETDVSEAFRDVRVPDTVTRPYPTAGIASRRSLFVSVEPRKIHSPHIAVGGRQRSAVGVCQRLEALPWKREFDRPTTVSILIVIQRAINGHRCSLTRERPFKLAKTPAPRMVLKSNAVKWLEL